VQPPAPPADSLLAQLAADLRPRISGEVRFDAGTRAAYAADHSMYRQPPIGVVIPRTLDDVIATVAVCRDHDVPILGRGCATSLAGQCCNTAVIIDFSKYLNRLIELNPGEKFAWVEPGIINDDLRRAAEHHNLTFAPDPATHAFCTLGGMIGNNSCGAHSVMGGKTSDNIDEMEILTYAGERMTVGPTSESDLEQIIRAGGARGQIYAQLKSIRDRYSALVRERFPNIPRRVSGYNLDALLPENNFNVARALVGTESTCVLVLRAKTRLMHSPQHRVLLLIAYPDICSAGDHSAALNALGPIAIEGFDKHLIENERRKGNHLPGAALYPDGAAWLLVEFGADSAGEALAKAQSAMDSIRSHDRDQLGINLISRPEQVRAAWAVRERGHGASRVPGEPETWCGWEDAAVPPEKVGVYLREFYALLAQYGYHCTLFGHFGQGCIHAQISFNTRTSDGLRNFRAFMEQAAHLVVRHGGSLSGEHGDGQSRAELLPIMFGPELMQAFRDFKTAWDPRWKMNPGKVIDPYPLDTNIRVGPDYHPKKLVTIFQFPQDGGSLAQATERCFGVGKCRALGGGTMCPSFQATREEIHSTRGRARMLFEMMRGEIITDGWRNENVKQALDLCLSCKGCKGDCPVNVDVATYKSEFLAHYYEGRVRPMAAYSMGQIHRWSRVAALAPALANLITQTPGLSTLAKASIGVAPARTMPKFARQNFRSWFFHRNRAHSQPANLPPVVLWADTFNNYFTPGVAQAAVAVLQSAGFAVSVPRAKLCCGRPLYDFGFLHQAKRQLRQILHVMRDDIAAGTPIVCLEPSCASVFRDELVNLFPNDDNAHKLRAQVVLLADFLAQHDYQPPPLHAKAILHGHCHQKALWNMSAEQRLFAAMGLDANLLDSGCCGMAGAFGFEHDHYALSQKIGERVLLPKVRNAAPETLIITDGFSCREQVRQSAGRHPLHLAEVIAKALNHLPPARH
jgi:FAD/FMN-containing dehydrogenase/Fe-S oxidoreductase